MSRREKLWVVRAGDGTTVGEIVRSAGEEPSAVDEGRVFIGRKRATRLDHPVRVGDTVRIGRISPGSGAADHGGPRGRPPSPQIEILFEEEGLVACIKPAGIPTVPDQHGGSHSLMALVAKALGREPEALRITSRLDRDVSGVVLFALDAGAEERLRSARAEGRYQRRYVAIASGMLAEPQGVWNAPIGRAPDPRLRLVRGPDAKAAATRWATISVAAAATGPPFTMLAVDPVTGRTHQIRIHASAAGAPLIGDRDYAGARRIVLPDGRILAPSRIALHAARVRVPSTPAHGRGDRFIEARAPIPEELTELWAALGGDGGAWNSALSCETPPFDPSL